MLLRPAMGAIDASVVALLVTTVASTAANRSLTFGVRRRAGAARHQILGRTDEQDPPLGDLIFVEK